MKASALALAAMLVATPAAADSRLDTFLKADRSAQEVYLLGYIDAHFDIALTLDVQAGAANASTYMQGCGRLTLMEIAELMRMKIRRSRYDTFSAARYDAFRTVCQGSD